MRKLNHIGIPTKKEQPDEMHMEDAKLHLTDFAKSPNKIEWLRFDEGSPMPELLQTTAHIAYEVDDIKAAMEGKEVLMEPFEPAENLTVGFIVEEGAPIELMQYS